MILTKEPDTGSIDLPPVLKPKGKPRPRCVVLPDIRHAKQHSRTLHDNCWTIHWRHMMRWWDDGRMEFAHVNSRRYRQWLETFTTETGVPPHISFGGAAIACPQGDPEFYSRWVTYVQETFC